MARNFRKYGKNNNENAQSVSNFGALLKKTREKHGMSIAEVAQELRIREDILLAIEQEDFSRIPPQGYSRNMIKSYARILGLNTNKITNMFLDSEYSYQLNKKQASFQKISTENKKRVPATIESPESKLKTPRQQIEQELLNKTNLELSGKIAQDNSPIGSRTMHAYGNKYKNTPRARRERDSEIQVNRGRKTNINKNSLAVRDLLETDDYRNAKKRLEARMNSKSKDRVSSEQNPFAKEGSKNKIFNGLRKRRKINRDESYKLNEDENPNTIKNAPQNTSSYQFMNIYQKHNNAAQSKLTIPIVAASVIVLLVILVLIFFFVGKQNENDKTDVSKLNVVGISDIEKKDTSINNNNNTETSVQTEEPKELEFKYKVKDTLPVYMEIYENNSSRPILAREVKPGETNTFKVTGSLKVVTSNPSLVDFYVNNQVVQPQDTKGNGVYTLDINFEDYLREWKIKNPKKNNS